MQGPDLLGPGILQFHCKYWYVWIGLRQYDVGLSFPTVGEFLFASQADILNQDTISGLKRSSAPDFKVIVPFMLSCTSLGCFLCHFVGEV